MNPHASTDLPFATGHGDVDKATGVCDTLLGPSLRHLLLLLRFHLSVSEAERFLRPTLGVCDLTFPARASDPWTLPMIAVASNLYV